MQRGPRPPMVCVKLPRSVLVVFHLFRATELPNFQGLKVVKFGFDHFACVSSRRSVVRFVLGQGSLLSAHVGVLTAHDAISASNPRGTSTPNLETGSSPRDGHGRAPLQ